MATLIDYIIDNIEGGYYHPDMKDANPQKFSIMGISGETMYGLDRKNGAGSAVTESDAGRAFWKLIDTHYSDHHADTTWYNDMADGRRVPAAVGAQLRDYTRQIITSMFNSYAGKYLSPGAKAVIMSSPQLQLQFLYAVWNGPAHFKTFADLVNAAYANGTRAASALYKLVNNARRQKGGLFAIGADKLDQICRDYLGGVSGENEGSALKWLLIAAAAIGVGYFIFKK